MKRTIMLVTAVVLASALAYGEEQPGPCHEHLKFFDAYVGTWSWNGTLEEDMGFGKKGDVGAGTITWRWAYNKNAIDWRWEFDFAGKREGTKGTIAWDASQSRLVGFGVSSDGGIIRVTGKSTNPLTLYVEGIDPEGNKESHVEDFTPSGDSMKIKSFERKGGTLTENSLEYTFKRVERSGRGPKRSEQP
jgi:hypothetical protein